MRFRLRLKHFWMTQVLILINLIVFGYQSLLSTLGDEHFEEIFGLSVPGLLEGRWWQFITHAFLHGNLLHIAVNMLGLWFGGRLVERVIGPWRFLTLYLFAAVSGGLFQMVLTGGNAILVGASGAVCGVILAFTTMFPNAELMVLLFFIIPLRLRAKFLGWGLVLSAALFQIIGFQTWIGHAAHLGGAIAGFVFARLSGFAEPSHFEYLILRFFGRRR